MGTRIHDLQFRGLSLVNIFPGVMLCFLFAASAAQNIQTIDSIRRQMSGATEAKQFELLNALGFEFRFSFPDSTIH